METFTSTKQVHYIKDKDGIIHLQSRLLNSDSTFNFKNPIVLRKESPLAKLLILDVHTSLLHSGVDSTLTNFLTKYWTPRARRLVKQVLHTCQKCLKMKSYPFALPDMPQLPESRVCRQILFHSSVLTTLVQLQL